MANVTAHVRDGSLFSNRSARRLRAAPDHRRNAMIILCSYYKKHIPGIVEGLFEAFFFNASAQLRERKLLQLLSFLCRGSGLQRQFFAELLIKFQSFSGSGTFKPLLE